MLNISKQQSINSSKNNWEDRPKHFNNCYIEFYLHRGMTYEEAKLALYNRQCTRKPYKLKEGFEKYRKLVLRISNIWVKKGFVENSHKRSSKYHLDHNFSTFDGFWNNISPEIIGHWSNIRIIPSRQNNTKYWNSDISLETLLERYNESVDREGNGDIRIRKIIDREYCRD